MVTMLPVTTAGQRLIIIEYFQLLFSISKDIFCIFDKFFHKKWFISKKLRIFAL